MRRPHASLRRGDFLGQDLEGAHLHAPQPRYTTAAFFRIELRWKRSRIQRLGIRRPVASAQEGALELGQCANVVITLQVTRNRRLM